MVTTRAIPCVPSVESRACSSSGLKRLSMYSFAKELGTAISNRLSYMPVGRVPSNQTRSDGSFMPWSERRSRTCIHNSSTERGATLLHPGADDGLDEVAPERGNLALPRVG